MENPTENYDDLLKKINKKFIIIDLNGKILFNTMEDQPIIPIKNYHNQPEILSALENNEGFSTRKSKITQKKMIYFALKLNPTQIIRVSIISNNAFKHIKISTYIHIILFSLLNLFALISYQFYSKRYLFDRIDQIKKMLEDGNEIKEIVSKDDRWLFKFWEVIKEWQDNNLKNIEKLKLEKIKLNNIISSVDMGIILVDTEKKIKLKNDAINFIYIRKDIKNYHKDIKYPQIIKFIDRMISKKENNISEIFLDDIQKYILLRGKYMKSRKEYLFTIKDITRNKETMEVQKNFITNVGHELKTPLTNIMGYLVALREEDDPCKRDKFINTIERNAGKLDNILMDFLNLSKIESSKVINLAPIHTSFLIDEINRSLENQIESKKVDLSYNLKLKTDFIRIDFDKTTMILKNLIENAIIYNNNLPKIKITIKEKFDKYKISVEDNGIGMNKSDTYKIFDRFYRVDKARTSNVAGTGLGLAIVYELVHLCGGEIDVESNKQGTIFTFTMIK